MAEKIKLIAIVSFLSFLFTLITIRGCFAGLMPTLICGEDFIRSSAYQKISGSTVTIVSNVPESQEYSLDKNRSADKLMDGNPTTAAAPASNEIDYVINLHDTYKIREVKIIWKDYGINKNYISQWSLETIGDNKEWIVIAEGGRQPGGKIIIDERFSASTLRLKALSEKDWIGVYEIEIIGRHL